MAVFWVQQWVPLPFVPQPSQMTDGRQPGGRLPFGNVPGDYPREGQHQGGDDYSISSNAPSKGSQYDLRLQDATQQTYSGGHAFDAAPQRARSYDRVQGPSGSAFDMSGFGSALPEYQHSQASSGFPNQQRLTFTAPPSNYGYPSQQISLFAGQTQTGNPNYVNPYASQFGPQLQQTTAAAQALAQSHVGHSAQNTGLNPTQAPYNSALYLTQQQQQLSFYSYGQGSQGQPGLRERSGPFPSPYGIGPSPSYGQTQVSGAMGGQVPIQAGFATGLPYGYGSAASRESVNPITGSVPSNPRGPPRKPKQSGYALWVGNLPPGTIITDLKDHFSRDATKDIESVFLISKSNCAFVNYRTETACAAAMTKFHDSRFQGVRLVCRLRRSPAATSSGIPTGPAALMPAAQSQPATEAIAQNREVSSQAEEKALLEAAQRGTSIVKTPEKFFIMKSLTVEDMMLSVRNGIWATQAHNEAALNKAYETSEVVYLIFSANKSGEYFGYARMASPITEDAAASLEWTPRVEPIPDDPDLPRAIPTVATEFAPRGRIIDDSARGTIFWEADPEDQDISPTSEGDVTKETQTTKETDVAEESQVQSFGKPFKVEWLSTSRLPFYRTRGLRNPWNANREVKIARDGTELETNVGRRLIQLFQRGPTPGGPPAGLDVPGTVPNVDYLPTRPPKPY